jgi:hypothetical protein
MLLLHETVLKILEVAVVLYMVVGDQGATAAQGP